MRASYLDIEIYESDGWTHRTQTLPLSKAADLELITGAIRRLDSSLYPFIYIRQTEDYESDYMNILGGGGAYMIEVQSRALDRFVDYIDPTKGAEEVELWRSDQGASIPEYNVCRDVSLVIAVAHEYALGGNLSSRVDWLIRRGIGA